MPRRAELLLVAALVACGAEKSPAPRRPAADTSVVGDAPSVADAAAPPDGSTTTPALPAATVRRDPSVSGFVYLARARLFATAAAARAEGAATREGEEGVAFAVVSDQGDVVEVETLAGQGHCSMQGRGRPVEPTLAASIALKGFVPKSKLSPVLTTLFLSTFSDGTELAIAAGTPVIEDPRRGLLVASAPFFVPVDASDVRLSYDVWTPPSLVGSAGFTSAQFDVVLPPLSFVGQRADVAIDPMSYPSGSPLRCAGPRCLFTSPCWHVIFTHGGTKTRGGGGVGFGGRPVLATAPPNATVWFTDGKIAGKTRIATRVHGTELDAQGALGGRRCFAQSLVAGGICFDRLDLK